MKRRATLDVRDHDVHAGVNIEFSDPHVECDGCGQVLGHVDMEHGEQGFGHYRRCCRCYERAMSGR